ncbi:MAG: serine/threonine protein kinase [Gemmataceae bacterium]|nr:serine/threonine protein kinase [Gemmataceae bacterium]
MSADPAGNSGRRALRIGKYEVLNHIATGGMGAVYRAIDTDLKREVALKVLPPELAIKPIVLERFRREARTAAKLRHENIVAIYEFGEFAGTYFLALEFVDGIDLHEYIARRNRLSPEKAVRLLIQAARALVHAHEHSVVHRDIKPSNFLVTRKNGATLLKLTDLGLARETNDDEFRVTRDGTTVGTVDYMAPEQARNAAAADIRSDIYSLGCTFYHMLAGHCPYPEGSLTERIYKHVEAKVPDIRQVAPAVPEGLVAILARMLAKKPEDRYQTPEELLKDLEDPRVIAGTAPARSDAELEIRLVEDNEAPILPPVLPPAPLPPAQPPAARPPSSTARPRARPPSTPAEPSRTVLPPEPVVELPGRRKRFRDEDDLASPHAVTATTNRRAGAERDTPRRRKRSAQSGLPRWWPFALGGAVLLVGAIVALVVFGGSDEEPPVRAGTDGGRKGGSPAKVKNAPTDANKEGDKGRPGDGSARGPDREAEVARLRAEFEGALANFPEPSDELMVLRVSRTLPGDPNTFRSLKEAVARAPKGRHSVIEIHDNGPLFESALAPAAGATLTIRAGTGFRPLIAWEGGGERFLAVADGSLFLSGLDVVMKQPNEGAGQPAVLFDVSGGDVAARDCTFGIAGRSPHGARVLQVGGTRQPARCRLSRCLVRGGDATALVLRGAGGEVLLDGSLIAGGARPVLDVAAAADATWTVRVVRSTLVGDKNLLSLAPAGKGGVPALRWLGWDALLGRVGGGAESAMVRLVDGAGTAQMTWRAVNCVYAGWPQLLHGGGREIAGTEDSVWRAVWGYTEGDRSLPGAWSKGLPGLVEEAPVSAFNPAGTPDFPTAMGGAGPVGCDLKALPRGRTAWLGLTFDPFIPLPLTSPSDEGPPEIPAPGDGRYHGERVVWTPGKPVDLGQLLRVRLQDKSPGPKVVLRLAGSGEQPTSPIQVRGADLVLYFEAPEGNAPPLSLTPNPATCADRPALIEVDGGGLEMTRAHLTFRNSSLTPMPVRLVRVHGGSLRLFGCRFVGPLGKAPPGYLEAIRFDGSGKEEAAAAFTCALSHCVLLSGKAGVRVQGTGVRLLLDQCVVAAGDGIVLAPGAAKARLNVHAALTRTTCAMMRSLLRLEDAPKLPPEVEPVVVQADACLFLDPFTEAPRRSALLRYEGNALARGLLVWQGKGNGYDERRLQAYAVPDADLTPARQAHAMWARLWGQAGEQQPIPVQWPATAQWTFSLDRPALDRMRPPQGRTGAGADPTLLKGAGVP